MTIQSLPFVPSVHAQESTISGQLSFTAPEATPSGEETEATESSPSSMADMPPEVFSTPSLLAGDVRSLSLPNPVSEGSAVIRKLFVSKLAKKTYQPKEKLSFRINGGRYNQFHIIVLNAHKKETPVQIQQSLEGEDRIITMAAPSEVQPGKYTVVVQDEHGVISEQSFLWGVLAMNPDKARYVPGEQAHIAIAVLNEFGQIVCDAAVELHVRRPDGSTEDLSTQNGHIQTTDQCHSIEVSLVPDYETSFPVSQIGTYALALSATTDNGSYAISDSIEVLDTLPYRVVRQAATRLYPRNTYPVTLAVTALEADFTGIITEVVPERFVVGKQHDDHVIAYDRIETVPAGSLQNEFALGPNFHLDLPFTPEASFSGEASASSVLGIASDMVTNGFGEALTDPLLIAKYAEYDLAGHDGIDFAMPIGTPVITVDDGTVLIAQKNFDYGTTIIVQHEWGRTYYGHLSSMDVSEGDSVRKGQRLGRSGNTGLSTGPHLHFGIRAKKFDRDNGYMGKIDPAPYLALPNQSAVLGASSSMDASIRVLTWNVHIPKGETVQLGYEYKTPKKSPMLYTIGPLRLFSSGNTFEYTEGRQWQLAVDAYTGSQVKTIEYLLGGGTDTTSRASGTAITYAGAIHDATKGTAGTVSIVIPGTNIQVRNAYLEARFVNQTSTDTTDIDMVFDSTPGPNVGTDTRVSPIIQNGGSMWDTSGLSGWQVVRADVTSQLSTQDDSDWVTGVAVVGGIATTGPSRASTTMKLVITYESDYSTSAHTEIKTVRFPLDSTVSGDTGSTRAACGASTTCSFDYTATIPDLLDDDTDNIASVFFEIHGMSDSSTAPSFTPQINGGSSGTSVSDQEVLGDLRDMYVLYQPAIGGSDFTPNTGQTLDIVNGAVALNTLGGELIVTYKYSTDAALQTETVRYWAQQQTTETSTTKTAFPDGASNIHISNGSFSVVNIWQKFHVAHSAAVTFTAYGKVGSASERSQAYTLTNTNNRAGESVIVHNLSQDVGSFTASPTKVTGASQFSSGTGDVEVAADVWVTFTWDGSSAGTQTKTVMFLGGNSVTSSAATTEYHNFPTNIFLPEAVTKTHRSTYIETTHMHSNATTISHAAQNVYLNGGSILAITDQEDTEAFARTLEASISATMFNGEASDTISWQRRAFMSSHTIANTNEFVASDVYVVTYDAAFDEDGVEESPKQLKTIEYVLGGGSDDTSRASTAFVYAGSSWNATKGSAGTVSIAIPGTGIQVRNAYVETRISASTATNMTDVDMTFDATPGPEAGTDGRVSPVVQGTYMETSGQGYWMMVRAPVGSQLSIQSDSQWNAGVAVVSGISVTGPSVQLTSMKLVITYESDYVESAHDEVKTVRFPLDSTVSGDTGTKQSACSASATCSFAYTANIPDLLDSDTGNIESVFFELHGVSESATAPSFTPQIQGGSSGTSYSDGEAISDTRDMFVLYGPSVGGSDFLPNTSQTLDIVNGSVDLNALGGELVITYVYNTGAAQQTETIQYFAQQQTAQTSTTKTAFTKSSFTISNASFSVSNIWYRVTTSQAAVNTLTVYGNVGGAGEQSNAYTLPGTSAPRVGESVVYYDMSADASSFSSSTTTVTGASQWSSATGDSEVGAELYITFTWSGNELGPQTKTVLFNAGTTGAASTIATEYHNFPVYIFLPESVAKTHRSTYVKNNITVGDATSISASTVTLALNGVTGFSMAFQDDTEEFSATSLQEISSSAFSEGSSIDFRRRAYALTDTWAAADRYAFSNVMVVTYDADFAIASSGTASLDELMRHGAWFSNGTKQAFTF